MKGALNKFSKYAFFTSQLRHNVRLILGQNTKIYLKHSSLGSRLLPFIFFYVEINK